MKKRGSGILLTILGITIGTGIGVFFNSKLTNRTIMEQKEKVEKFKGYYHLLNQWLTLKQNGDTLEQYLIENNYKTIAIYGMGELGAKLYHELKNSSINLKYAIDKSGMMASSEIKTYDLDDELEEVDAIIVTAVFAYDSIKSELETKVNCPILSLEDVVFGVNS